MYTARCANWAVRGRPVSRRRGVTISDRRKHRHQGEPAMGKIVISTNVSLDGVVQDPDGREGFSRGGWFAQPGSRDFEEWGKVEYAEALDTAALLLGRRSDEWFGTR